MKNNKLVLNSEYNRIINKIENNENFVLFRYGDGEYSIMNGISVTAQEGWKSPNIISELGFALKNTLELNDENVYYGISCPCCDRSAYYWYMTNIDNKNITFANIFVNYNYKYFRKDFEKIKRDAIVIANYKGKNNKIGNLNILKYYEVGDDCIEFWSEKCEDLINSIIKEYGNRKDLLYVVSAGPMSEPIIYELYKNNKENCYIDFGSSIDIYIHGVDTRPYSNEKTVYAKRNCWMYEPKDTNFDVSVILTTYKKPDALERQIDAIVNQTLKPKEILLYKDGINDNYNIEFKGELLNRFDDVKISKVNMGVWERFKYAKDTAENEYICLFDDDTIPGKKWLENCHFNMLENEGVYGTIGIVLKKKSKYPFEGYFKVGWNRPSPRLEKADFVGHSWFIKKKHLEYMFNGTEKYQKYKFAAEDMCLSFSCKKHGINTFVPPHPYNDIELWGSLPKYGWKFGQSSTAISLSDNNLLSMKDAADEFISDGWEKVCETDNKEIRKMNRIIKFEETKKLIKKVIHILKRKIIGE